MTSRNFAQFVAKQQNTSQPIENGKDLTWDEIRDEWLARLEQLYDQIEQFLTEFIEDHSITTSFSEIPLNEANIGSYEARKMEIQIGRQTVYLEPIGTWLIGSRGRVDVVGSAGRAQLILVNEEAKSAKDLVKVFSPSAQLFSLMENPELTAPISWAWKIVVRGGSVKFLDFNKNSFLSLLMEVAGG
jgi:hypothetical protein